VDIRKGGWGLWGGGGGRGTVDGGGGDLRIYLANVKEMITNDHVFTLIGNITGLPLNILMII